MVAAIHEPRMTGVDRRIGHGSDTADRFGMNCRQQRRVRLNARSGVRAWLGSGWLGCWRCCASLLCAPRGAGLSRGVRVLSVGPS